MGLKGNDMYGFYLKNQSDILIPKTSGNPGEVQRKPHRDNGSLSQGRSERGPVKSPNWLRAPGFYTEMGSGVDNPISYWSTGSHCLPGMELSLVTPPLSRVIASWPFGGAEMALPKLCLDLCARS